MREGDLYGGVTPSQRFDHGKSLQALADGGRVEPDRWPCGIALFFSPPS